MESLLIGKVVEGYEIVRILGQGGMGTVFEAIDTSLNINVALKLMDSRLVKEKEFLTRFRTEGRSQAKLRHPNIVIVHALRESEIGPFIVMELVDGPPLSELIRARGAFSWDSAKPLLLQLLSGLDHAHSSGVIHRDIKPGNLLVSKSGQVKITDFGLARIQQDLGMTSTGFVSGTLFYASPEQIRSLRDADHRSDIYSVGMTLYELIAGRSPFNPSDSNLSIQMKILEGKVPDPLEVCDTMPPHIAALIRRAIEREPHDRYQSALEMIAAVRREEDPSSKTTSLIRTRSKSAAGTNASLLQSKWAWIIALLLVGVIGSLGYFQTGPGLAETETAVAQPESTGTMIDPVEIMDAADQPQVGTAQINSNPAGASIWLNGKSLGVKTPHTLDSLSLGEHRLQLRMNGYQNHDGTIEITRERQALFHAGLIALRGDLNISSTPGGAAIYINGRRQAGRFTPATLADLPSGRYTVRLEKSGYQSFQTTVSVKSGQRASVQGTLAREGGLISIRVLPYGSISIDNALLEQESSKEEQFRLQPGTHLVAVTHPDFGRWEKQVEVRTDALLNLTVDFNQFFAVRVTAFDDSGKPLFAEIFVDGKPSGFTAPKELRLRAGVHVIEVRLQGYQLTEGARRINLDETLATPLKFVLTR